jgi:ubiquinone/menaquinone biosynthesis C-methylase UbiE
MADRVPSSSSAAKPPEPRTGLLGDTAARNYSRKLQLFNACAEPELRQIIASMGLEPGTRVLDAGCGTGETLQWLHGAVGRHGVVVGVDLAAAHAQAARAAVSSEIMVVQADLMRLPFVPRSFDLIWSVNTVNHFGDALAGLKSLTTLLTPDGRVMVGQSSLLPEMYFAWDSRLERLTTEAVRQYYRERYSLTERQLAGTRALLGLLRGAKLKNIRVRTVVIERTYPVDPATEAYIVEAIFRDSWGERLRPYLPREDYEELVSLCDPSHPAFALRREDFHFLQTLTTLTGELN